MSKDWIEIDLGKGLVAVIDAADKPLVAGRRWYARFGPKTTYAYSSSKRNGKTTATPMHRLILDAKPGCEVDHINGNGLDNRRANLRLCSIAENRRNAAKRSDNTSGYKGVRGLDPEGYWRADIYVNGKAVYVIKSKSAIKAALAYDEAARKFHGPFACLNFPKPGERGAR